jgi:hypothetical protein
MLVKTNLHIKGLDEDLGGTVIMVPDPGSFERRLANWGVV